MPPSQNSALPSVSPVNTACRQHPKNPPNPAQSSFTGETSCSPQRDSELIRPRGLFDPSEGTNRNKNGVCAGWGPPRPQTMVHLSVQSLVSVLAQSPLSHGVERIKWRAFQKDSHEALLSGVPASVISPSCRACWGRPRVMHFHPTVTSGRITNGVCAIPVFAFVPLRGRAGKLIPVSHRHHRTVVGQPP